MASERFDSPLSERLLELVYGLPAEDEAESRRRVADDPSWATAHAEAQRAAELLAAAARMPAPKVEYRSQRRRRSSAQRRSSATTGMHWERGAHLAIGLIATTLLVVSVAAWLLQRQQLADMAAEHVRLIVCGPARLHAGAANAYSIETSTVDGTPLPAQVELALFPGGVPEGKPLLRQKDETDRDGHLHLAIPADMDSAAGLLEVRATFQNKVERIQSPLAVVPVQRRAVLEIDRRWYQPGQTLCFRSVVLSRYGLNADHEILLAFAIRDPRGRIVPGTAASGWTKRGVACGTFNVPGNLPASNLPAGIPPAGGSPAGQTYELVMWSPSGECAELRQPFEVKPREALSATDAPTVAVRTQRSELAARGETLPTRLDKPLEPSPKAAAVRVRFFPEGGRLAVGLENRIYFLASDAAGQPIELRGRIVDEAGADCGSVATTHHGRGQFRLLPAADKHYRLQVTSPLHVTSEPALPDVAAGQTVTLSALEGICEPGLPLKLEIQSATAGQPLVVAAYCRGLPVAQRPLATREGINEVALPLTADVCGVLRVVLYDYSAQPPRPLAERLVYRRAGRRLRLSFAEHGKYYAPGEKVSLMLRVTNEKGESVPAVLGVSVTDQRPEIASHLPAGLLTSFLLANDLAGAATPEASSVSPQATASGALRIETDLTGATDLDASLAENSEATAALDLLLGTSAAAASAPVGRPADVAQDLVPPAVFDNLGLLRARYQESFNAYRAGRNRFVDTLTTVGFFGGFGLILLVTLLAVLRLAAGILNWVPALLAAACCVAIGAVLMNPERLKPQVSTATAFCPFSLPPAADGDAPAARKAEVSHRATGGAAAALSPPPGSDEALDPPDQPLLRLSLDPAPAVVTEANRGLIYWNPALITGTDGRARIDFDLPDDDNRYAVRVEAHGEGRLGDLIDRVTGRRPFTLHAQLPAGATAGDRLRVPLDIGNGTDQKQKIDVAVTLPYGSPQPLDPQRALELDVGQQQREWFHFPPVAARQSTVTFRASNESFSDQIRRRLDVTPPGYPVSRAWSGRLEGRAQMTVDVPKDLVGGSIRAELVLFPSVWGELQAALNSQGPPTGRCLEPLASRAALAALALKYAADNGLTNLPDIPHWRRAGLDLVQRLDEYRGSQGGFTWFGHDPADVPLSADVLVQLRETVGAGLLDPAILRKQVDWLAGQWSAERGFAPSARPQQPQPPADVVNAFALWALRDAGQAVTAGNTGPLLERAKKSDDPYILALAALIAPPEQAVAPNAVLQKLAAAQAADGHLDARSSIFLSEGRGRMIEATALAALAWTRSGQFQHEAERAIAWLLGNRDADARFGTWHATNLALRAILARDAATRPQAVAGKIFVRRGDDLLAQQSIEAGQREAVVVGGWEEKLAAGENHLSFNLNGTGSIPYLLRISYYQTQAPPTPGCPLTLATQFSGSRVAMGRPIEFLAEVANTTRQPQPLVVAVVGLPGGLEPPLEELKSLEKSGVIDAFETRPREVVLYWQSLAAEKKIAVRLHPSAALPGRYTSPPSAVYRANVPESCSWAAPQRVEVGEL